MNLTFDRFGSILFALIGAMFIVESRSISTSAYGSEVGPNMFPLGLGIILLVLSLRLFWETLMQKGTKNTSASADKLNYKRFLPILIATFLYVFLLETFGYVIASFLFLTFAFRVMGNASIVKAALVSLVFSASVYFIYVYLLKGTLPEFPAWLGV